MKRSRFTEVQIIGILKEQESGTPTAEVCREHGISAATFYKDKARFGGLDVSEAQRRKSLEGENGKLKKRWRRRCSTWPFSRMLRQKMLAPDAKREAVARVVAVHGSASVGRAMV